MFDTIMLQWIGISVASLLVGAGVTYLAYRFTYNRLNRQLQDLAHRHSQFERVHRNVARLDRKIYEQAWLMESQREILEFVDMLAPETKPSYVDVRFEYDLDESTVTGTAKPRAETAKDVVDRGIKEGEKKNVVKAKPENTKRRPTTKPPSRKPRELKYAPVVHAVFPVTKRPDDQLNGSTECNILLVDTEDREGRLRVTSDLDKVTCKRCLKATAWVSGEGVPR